LSYFKECEQELRRLKNLLDENCRTMATSEVTRSLTDELSEVCKHRSI